MLDGATENGRWPVANACAPQDRRGRGGARVPYTPCFAEGTLIATLRGAIAIEDLRIGDRVLTRDHGYQPIRWIGGRHFDQDTLSEFGALRPVVLRRGCLGGAGPDCDLVVSPQHRVLVTGPLSLEISGESECLVPAIDLVGMADIATSEAGEVTYFHILFDAHEVILSSGCWTESFLPDAESMTGLHQAQAAEILAIFPELAALTGEARFAPARSCVSREGEAPARIAA